MGVRGAGRQGRPTEGVGAGARENCRAGALGRLGPLPWPQPGPVPSQVHGERVILSTREARVSLQWGGRGPQWEAGFNESFRSFLPPYLHPGFPRKAWFSHCPRRPLQENAIGLF